MKVCKDCPPDQPVSKRRPAPHPGPRCMTHHRAKRKADKLRAHGRRVETVYGITAEEYAELYALQGGRCYVCVRSTGARKRLAVEHDHTLALAHGHAPEQGCRECVTGLVCGPCNQDVLGRLGRNPATYRRIADALEDSPARRLFRRTTP